VPAQASAGTRLPTQVDTDKDHESDDERDQPERGNAAPIHSPDAGKFR
jgi:hypothetical protein